MGLAFVPYAADSVDREASHQAVADREVMGRVLDIVVDEWAVRDASFTQDLSGTAWEMIFISMTIPQKKAASIIFSDSCRRCAADQT
jgi:hypothetical protein